MLRISVRKRITDANAAASHRKLLPLGECVGYSLRPIGCAAATLAAAALVVSLVSEAVVDGVGWRDHGCGPSTKPTDNRTPRSRWITVHRFVAAIESPP